MIAYTAAAGGLLLLLSWMLYGLGGIYVYLAAALMVLGGIIHMLLLLYIALRVTLIVRRTWRRAAGNIRQPRNYDYMFIRRAGLTSGGLLILCGMVMMLFDWAGMHAAGVILCMFSVMTTLYVQALFGDEDVDLMHYLTKGRIR